MKSNLSREQFARACRVIPGGVNSPARAFGGVGGSPIVVARGDGPYLWDVDGNRYVDLVGSWGPHLLGHRHPAVLRALSAALERGTSFGAPTVVETEMAELICRSLPSVEMVRMVNSGTEATMSAIRLARGFTGRDKIIKFAGCYHGHVDSLLVQAGSAATTLGVPSSPGVPAACTSDTIVLEFNDREGLERAFAAHGDALAAVILEPVVGNMGCVLPEPGFLEACRSLCDAHGALLVFDEVMTGFRVAWGGAQQRFGIRPDLTTLGKIIGGGLPVGAYGGRAAVMQRISPLGPVYQAGTLSGNPLAMASGLATLQTIEQTDPYPRLEAQAQRLVDGWSALATARGIPHCTARCGSMFTLFFQAGPVRNYADAKRSNTDRFARFFWGMLERGVYLPCSQFEACFLSAAHTDAEIDFILEAAEAAFAGLA